MQTLFTFQIYNYANCYKYMQLRYTTECLYELNILSFEFRQCLPHLTLAVLIVNYTVLAAYALS